MTRLTLNQYQEHAKTTAKYPQHSAMEYLAMGLCSEAGEVAGKVKKIIRDNASWSAMDLAMEVGDVLWYVSELCSFLDMELEEVAQMNLEKLADRAKRGAIGGSGDNR